MVSLLAPRLEGALALGVPLYAVALTTTLWCAVASASARSWAGLCPCVGALLYAVSDALIGFHMFHRLIAHSQVLIMATYFAAQLGMALSVVGDSGDAVMTRTATPLTEDEAPPTR